MADLSRVLDQESDVILDRKKNDMFIFTNLSN